MALEEQDPNSILHFYRRCLMLRKRSQTLLWGAYREYGRHNRKRYVYERRLGDERILVICSFSGENQKYKLPPGYYAAEAERLLCNYPEAGIAGLLRPYEARVYRFSTSADTP